jgi:hypothetical protein
VSLAAAGASRRDVIEDRGSRPPSSGSGGTEYAITTPDPEPGRTPGLEPGGGVPPGETPPAEGSTSGIAHPEPVELRRAWGPWPAAVVIGLAVVVALMLIFMIIALTI